MEEVRPRGGYPGFVRPKGAPAAFVDPTTGQLATYSCPYSETEIFVARFAPHDVCQRHSGFWGSEPVSQPGEQGLGRARGRGGIRCFLERVFGGDERGGGGTDGGEGEEEEDGDGSGPGASRPKTV